jgi:hypothetical protein
LDEDCYGGGKYCAVEKNDEGYKLKGRQIIMEDLRQKCLYKRYYNATATRHVWWDYMNYVHKTCHNSITEECSFNAHVELDLPFTWTTDCVK